MIIHVHSLSFGGINMHSISASSLWPYKVSSERANSVFDKKQSWLLLLYECGCSICVLVFAVGPRIEMIGKSSVVAALFVWQVYCLLRCAQTFFRTCHVNHGKGLMSVTVI